MELNFANAVSLVFSTGGSGNFTVGEIVTGGSSNVTAEVKSWDSTTRTLIVINRSGTFTIPETITGDDSSAAWITSSYNTINNLNSSYDENVDIEIEADNILDFTESNPFGEYGNRGGVV